MSIISNENQSLQILNEKTGRELKFSVNEEGNIIYLSLYSKNFPILPNELKNFPSLIVSCRNSDKILS